MYLSELRKKKLKEKVEYVTGRILRAKEILNNSCKTGADDDIVLLDNEKETEKENNNMHVKLLQFSENYRPPYYGTWRKSSKFVSPRNPFKKDEVSFPIVFGLLVLSLLLGSFVVHVVHVVTLSSDTLYPSV